MSFSLVFPSLDSVQFSIHASLSLPYQLSSPLLLLSITPQLSYSTASYDILFLSPPSLLVPVHYASGWSQVLLTPLPPSRAATQPFWGAGIPAVTVYIPSLPPAAWLH